jgi:hypothetical protein
MTAAPHRLIVAVEPPRLSWRCLPGGRFAHAVTTWSGRDRAACGVRPRLGAGWLSSTQRMLPRCSRCAAKDGAGDQT